MTPIADRVRLVDAPAVGWTVAGAFSNTRTQAAVVAPLWALCCYMLPGVRHFDRVAVVSIHRRGALPVDLVRACVIAVVWTVVASGVSVLVQLGTGMVIPSWVWLTPLLLLLPGVVVILRRPAAAGGGAFSDPPGEWIVALLAGRPGSCAMTRTFALINDTVPSNASIGVRAATERLAWLYEHRYGFHPVNPRRPLELVRPALTGATGE